MRTRLFLLLPLAVLAGCAGYASDYWRPAVQIITPQLTRYGFDATQTHCAGRRLAAGLTVWQLRQLEGIARLVPPSQFGRASLAPRDLITVAAAVRDARVRPEVTAAVEACVPPPPAPVVAQPVAAPAQSGAPLWLNLGAAPTGQSIAVNAASIVDEAGYRQAWFRLTNPGAGVPSENSYLLRIVCAARTINSMAFRRHAADGQVAEERDYRPNGEGATPIAGGTVMEIAYLALCT